jgi:mevalonate kinase
MGGIGRSSGKLILFGEHAAVYGHPAVGVSLPEGTTVHLGDAALPGWDLGSIAMEDREGIRAILARLEDALPGLAARGRCAVQIESGIARKAGFGSSAALCGAFARAALAHAGEDGDAGGDLTRAWTLAHDAERIFHGTPSGVDTGLSLLGGMCVLRPRPPELPEFWRVAGRALHLVVGAVPRDAACAALVGSLAARVKSGDRAARTSIEALGRIAADAARILLSDASAINEAFGILAGRAMDQLRAIGLSTPELDQLLEAAKAAGALGGKLSGAGAGGAFFAVARDRPTASLIVSRLESAAAAGGLALASPLRVIQA